mgnify:FL=1
MPSNNTKYTEEMRTQTAEFILNTGKSATSVVEEMGIDTNTVCRWVRDYKRKNNLPTYAEAKGIVPNKPVSLQEVKMKMRDLERENKRVNKELAEERIKVEILKKSLHIFMQAPE